MGYVMVEENHIKNIANAIRTKSGKTEKIKPVDMAIEIESMEMGSGGSGEAGDSDLVAYVSFMNEAGTEELYNKPTIKGDDCVDVVSKGLMSKPTKESSNTTNYTYSGFSKTPNSPADFDSLKNITEDRVLYASFSSSVRYYKVNFYDDETDTTPTSFDVTYGSDASSLYIPEKDGFLFTGWSEPVNNITSDINVYGTWKESLSFAAASWSKIAELSESGEISTMFKVGDEKTINLNGEVVTLRIAGFNHDDLADGSGKAGVTIIAKTVSSTIKGKSPYIMYNDSDRLLVENLFIPHLNHLILHFRF